MIQQIPKTKGMPIQPPMVLAAKTESSNLPVENFSHEKNPTLIAAVSHQTEAVLKWFLQL